MSEDCGEKGQQIALPGATSLVKYNIMLNIPKEDDSLNIDCQFQTNQGKIEFYKAV